MKFLVLFIFISSFVNSSVISDKSCSREDSRLVRDYFTQALGPIYEKHHLSIPRECVFSPLRDSFYQQELNKAKLSDNKWLCNYCNKTFHSEDHLDIHLANRHNHALIKGEQSVCLADYCSIFRCDILKRSKKSIRSFNLLTPYSDISSRKSKHDIHEHQLIILRSRCASMINQCIPQNMNYDIRVKIQHEMYAEICAYLTDNKYFELPTYRKSLINFTTFFCWTIFLGTCFVGIRIIRQSNWAWNTNDEDESEKHLSDETISTATALLSTTPANGIIHLSKNPTSTTIRHRVRFKSLEECQQSHNEPL